MNYRLDLDDIQGNVVRAYGKYSYPFARYFFLNISDPAKGRAFVGEVSKRVTTAARWPTPDARPRCTLNIGFTFFGLFRLEVPTRTLQALPEEFIAGMKDRAFLLGDRDQTMTEDQADRQNWDGHWDPIWQRNRRGDGYDDDNVHIWISLNALRDVTPEHALDGKPDPKLTRMDPVPELEETTQWLRDLCAANGGVRILPGNGQDGSADFHAAQAVFDRFGDVWLPTPKEHFGFTDGIGDPIFAGQLPEKDEKEAVIGRGKRMGKGWEPLNPGEFILGHPDESQELPPTAKPPEFMRNGSFMAYRKLHENVGSFREVIATEADRYARVQGILPDEAQVTLRARMVGRWPDGIPLAHAPTFSDWQKARAETGMDDPNPLKAYENQIAYIKSTRSSDFRYADDMKGYRTPPGAHMRRVNTRDYLEPLNAPEGDNPQATTALNKRRRIMRRGLPYGALPSDQQTDKTEQGVTMMIICASLFRQFEFIQQQWIQYGLDFHQGNDTCPILGNHDKHRRMALPADPQGGGCPYTMSQLKTVVECRGGDYFFIPSITALRMLTMGVIDPT